MRAGHRCVQCACSAGGLYLYIVAAESEGHTHVILLILAGWSPEVRVEACLCSLKGVAHSALRQGLVELARLQLLRLLEDARPERGVVLELAREADGHVEADDLVIQVVAQLRHAWLEIRHQPLEVAEVFGGGLEAVEDGTGAESCCYLLRFDAWA